MNATNHIIVFVTPAVGFINKTSVGVSKSIVDALEKIVETTESILDAIETMAETTESILDATKTMLNLAETIPGNSTSIVCGPQRIVFVYRRRVSAEETGRSVTSTTVSVASTTVFVSSTTGLVIVSMRIMTMSMRVVTMSIVGDTTQIDSFHQVADWLGFERALRHDAHCRCDRERGPFDEARSHDAVEDLPRDPGNAHRSHDRFLSLEPCSHRVREDRLLHRSNPLRRGAPRLRDETTLPVARSIVLATDTSFFATRQGCPSQRTLSALCRRSSRFNKPSTINHRRKTMSQPIRLLQNYKRQTDGQLIAAAGAVIQGMTGNGVFASPPVDLKTAQAAVDELSAAAAAQVQGGTAATAHKNSKRAALMAILAKLAHYVQDNCGGDVAAVLNAGFTVATFGRATSPLEKPGIAGIDFGNTTQLVVKVNPVARAKCYELRYAAIGVGGSPDAWQSAGLFTNSRSMTVHGLTPGTTYAFQVRAVGSAGYTDWSNSVAHITL